MDTSFYNKPGAATSTDPMAEAMKVVQLRNELGNLNKMVGGQPGTQGALGQLGAGQPYQPTVSP